MLNRDEAIYLNYYTDLKIMSKIEVNAFAAQDVGEKFKPFQYELPEIGAEEVDIKVEYCGICHSDLSMLKNDWGVTQYPFVPGHEVVGKIVRAGDAVKGVSVGDVVGLGWFSHSCLHCNQCLSGNHNLCASNGQTIVGRYGGFADFVRCHWLWAIPLNNKINSYSAGPLFCGGITVFSPMLLANLKPTDRVGVIGIGGLGHLALQFLNKWGCEVTAFSSSDEKSEQAKKFGAHHIINSNNEDDLKEISGSLDFIINTTNVNLNWQLYLEALAPNGKFHTVGALLDPIPVQAFTLISGQKSISGSPLGSPAVIRSMLEFCARHDIAPMTEEFKLEDVNEAMDHLESGKARYRVVLKV